MINLDTLYNIATESIKSTAHKCVFETAQDTIPKFAAKFIDGNVFDYSESLEQLTLTSITCAWVIMIVLGLSAYFLRNKYAKKFFNFVPVILCVAFIGTIWKILPEISHNMGKEGFILASLLLFGLSVLIYLGITISRSDKTLGHIKLLRPFIIIGVYGAVVYDIGMFTGNGVSLFTNLPMAILYGFRIFLFNSDVSELQTDFHENWLYSANFALVHFLAAFLTTLFVIKHFGFNIIQKFKLWFACLRSAKPNVYLFWGYNESVHELAESINDHYEKSNRDDYRIIIVRTDSDYDDTPENSTGFRRIFNFISTRNSEIDSLKELNCLTLGTYHKLEDAKYKENETIDILEGEMKLKSLCRFLSKKGIKTLHIMFLSNEEKENIQCVNALLHDTTINNILNYQSHHITFYCHARFNGPNRVFQDFTSQNFEIKIVDSSHIAVERLKLNPEFHPFNVVEMDTENPVTVKDPFNALIVGFGEVGRDAFRFLYEFATFADINISTKNARRSEFNCTVVDKDLDKLEGAFKAEMPAIFNNTASNINIDFKSIDYNQEDFYNKVLDKNKIANLNYVVISIGDTDDAISLAINIFNRFRKYGGDLSKLMILVRCTDNSKVKIVQKIANHYNFGYGEGDKNKPVIRIFGVPHETYTYDLIISDELLKLGMEYHENYRLIKGDNETWEDRRRKAKPNPLPDIYKLRKLTRQESQDMANALHRHTKMAFFKAAMPENLDWSNFLERYFKSDGKPNREGQKSLITYPKLSEKENLIILRLAMLEHLRWNAAHELMGYVRRDDEEASCDEATMRHNCLKNWNELDHESEFTEETEYVSDFKEFDFAVVDTTIAISQTEGNND